MLTKVSFIGVDAKTNLKDLQPIIYYGNQHGIEVEFGLLYSTTNTGNRYQLPRNPRQFIQECSAAGVTPSIHLCGAGAIQEFLDCNFKPLEGFNKIQLNINFSRFDDANVIRRAVQFFLVQDKDNLVVFQQNRRTVDFVTEILEGMDEQLVQEQIGVLFDSSGGHGKVLDLDSLDNTVPSYNLHGNQRFVMGYAGGISPDTVADIVAHIENKRQHEHPKGDYYIDMENGVRDSEDWFSLDKCWQVLDKIVKSDSN